MSSSPLKNQEPGGSDAACGSPEADHKRGLNPSARQRCWRKRGQAPACGPLQVEHGPIVAGV